MEVREKILNFFKENFLVDLNGSFDDDDSFLDKRIIDSTGVLELVMFIETSFGIKVEDDEIIPENLDSINRLETYIKKKVKG
jgi:acyl carrier protein